MEALSAEHRGKPDAAFGQERSLDARMNVHVLYTRIASYLAQELVELGVSRPIGDRIRFLYLC